MKQTTAEWFLDKINNTDYLNQYEIDNIIQKAKQMDKEKKIEGFDYIVEVKSIDDNFYLEGKVLQKNL